MTAPSKSCSCCMQSCEARTNMHTGRKIQVCCQRVDARDSSCLIREQARTSDYTVGMRGLAHCQSEQSRVRLRRQAATSQGH